VGTSATDEVTILYYAVTDLCPQYKPELQAWYESNTPPSSG